MTIEILHDEVLDDKIVQGKNKIEINLPISWYSTTKTEGFSMTSSGKGSYFGPNQMFGGPRGGELVLFDTSEFPFFAIITNWTQDHVSRKCTLKFLCWKSDFWNRVKDGIVDASINEDIPDKKLFKYCCDTFGLNTAVDISMKVGNTRLTKFIQSL